MTKAKSSSVSNQSMGLQVECEGIDQLSWSTPGFLGKSMLQELDIDVQELALGKDRQHWIFLSSMRIPKARSLFHPLL
jgi:hypothetical protein